MFIHLHSYYSLRYGTLSLEDLVLGLKINGYDKAVLSDINNSTAALDFARLCLKNGISPVLGMEFQEKNLTIFRAVAKNSEGFKEINTLRTFLNAHDKSLFNIYLQNSPDLKLNNCFLIYPLDFSLRHLKLHEWKENEFIGVSLEDRAALKKLDSILLEKIVFYSLVSFGENDFEFHKQLRAIDENLLLSHLNTEQVGKPHQVFVNKSRLVNAFKSWPEILKRSEELFEACTFEFDYSTLKTKNNFSGSLQSDKELIFNLTKTGFNKVYGEGNKKAWERVLKELDIIEELNFGSYFLITQDICRYARSRNYAYVGRGSGANSAVAYCLGITQVDPIALNLPFERFLNPKRQSMPDFDIDFSWDERDDIYDYIFSKYPQGHVALMGAMTTFKSRSIIRELGKIHGLPKADIDRLVHDPGHPLNQNSICLGILKSFERMANFPNQRTIHASGVLISEKSLMNYCAFDYPPKGLPTLQFDMYAAEDIGFEKFDILSQRGLGHIKECKNIIYQNHGKEISFENLETVYSDPHIADQLESAKTIGCFYIESPAMRQLLTKLRCRDYLTLVAASSIIRPGVSSSGMMTEFIKRHKNPELAQYPHPIFKEQLEETYGVMVYQEDVMKIAHAYGGLDMADADVLRRMMSGKYRNKDRIIEIEKKFFENCKDKGYDLNISKEIWRQMESFAGYSFNKAHSASFATESYQSLYLKTYYPLEFMVSVLNNHGGFYNRKVYINEAKQSGAHIHLPCIQKSKEKALIFGKDIYLGFDGILGLENKVILKIISERQKNGQFKSLENFINRTSIKLDQLIVLIRLGSLRSLSNSKKELLWKAHLLLSEAQEVNSQVIFETETHWQLPTLEHNLIEDFYDEIELLGFPISGTLFDLAKSSYKSDVFAHNLSEHVGKTVRMIGEMVCEKPVRTKRNEIMKFGTFLDSNGDFFDTVHFPPSLIHYPLRGDGLYLIEGKVVNEYSAYALEVEKCGKMPLKPDPRSV